MFFYCKRRKIAHIVTLSLTALSIVICFIVSTSGKYGLFEPSSSGYLNAYLTKPWTRFVPYGFGVTIGLLFFEYKDQNQDQKLMNGFGASIFNRLKNSAWPMQFIILAICIAIQIVLFQLLGVYYRHCDFAKGNCWKNQTFAATLMNTFSTPCWTISLLFICPILVG